jgi:GntR family transcriptional regulator
MLIEKTIDRESQQKLYVQIYTIIKEKIEKGDWPAGTQIPTEDELCKTYDVSKATVRIAISELGRDGFLVRKQGKGTFVTYSMPHLGVDMKTRLTENMFGEGVKVKKEILVKGVKAPSGEIKEYLKTGEDVYYVLCKRVVDGEPAYLEESFFPLFMFPDIEAEDICQTSFYQLAQENANMKIAKVIQTIEVTEISGDAADILKVKSGSAALLMHRLIVSSSGTPIAYARMLGSGRTYKIQTEFDRIK